MNHNAESSQAVAIIGGSFDPVHLGHIGLGLAAQAVLDLDECRVMPCRIAPHKKAYSISDSHRVAMLELAIAQLSDWCIDTRELEQERTSYSVLSLQELRQEFGAKAKLYFIIGWDSLENLSTWHRWQELFELSNILVAPRSMNEGGDSERLEDSVNSDYLFQQYGAPLDALKESTHGKLARLPFSELAISSSTIRRALSKVNTSIELQNDLAAQVHLDVLHYLMKHKLYSEG